MPVFHENLRFDFKHKAIDYQNANGLAWTHFVAWDGRGFRIYPHKDRMNAETRKFYK